jgi:hypothetical protein
MVRAPCPPIEWPMMLWRDFLRLPCAPSLGLIIHLGDRGALAGLDQE